MERSSLWMGFAGVVLDITIAVESVRHVMLKNLQSIELPILAAIETMNSKSDSNETST